MPKLAISRQPLPRCSLLAAALPPREREQKEKKSYFNGRPIAPPLLVQIMVAFRMDTPEDLDNKQNNFREFCQQTSLHGWQHIQRVHTVKGRIVWFSIVLASLAVASLFLATAAKDFVLRSVVTTIETTTGPLQVRWHSD